MVFSADKKSMAYVAGDGNENYVVVDGAEGPAFDDVYDLGFSPVGSRLAYGARRGLEHFVVEGAKEHGPYENIQRGSLVFRPDAGTWPGLPLGQMAIGTSASTARRSTRDATAWSVRLHSLLACRCRLMWVGICPTENQPLPCHFGGKIGRKYDAIWMGDGGKLFVQENGSIKYLAKSGSLLYRNIAKAE